MTYALNVAGIAPISYNRDDMMSQMLHGYQSAAMPKQMKQESLNRDYTNAIKAAEAQYAPEAEKLALALKQALLTHAKNAEARAQAAAQGQATGTGGNVLANASPRERRMLFNGLGVDGKAELYRRGSILGWSPEETQENFIKGVIPGQAAKEQGIDLGEGEGSYLATGANRKNINDAVSRGAELDYLEDQISGDFSTYGATFGGYSPAQIKDSFNGGDKATQEQLIRFMGARALQPELAAARYAIAGGSNAQEALKHAQDAALGNIKVPGFTITPEIREGVQRYINEKLRGGMKVKKKSHARLRNMKIPREKKDFLKL